MWRPSYVRRAPRWHDGIGRLLDLGSTFDLRLPPETDAERLAEDELMVLEDMRAAVDRLRSTAAELEG